MSELYRIYGAKDKKQIAIFSYIQAGGESPLDYHAELEISLFMNVGGVYKINDKDYEFKSGDVFIMQSGIPHKVVKTYGQGLLYNFIFEQRFLWELSLFDNNAFNVFVGNPRDFKHMLDRGNAKHNDIVNDIINIYHEFKESKRGYEQMVRVYLMKILITLARDFGYTGDTEFVDEKNVLEISRTMKYINEYYFEKITLSALARMSGMSEAYFGRIFKRLSGVTPLEYINTKRIEKAIEILKEHSNITMYALAKECGFNNTANFNRTFKKLTGQVPSHYRKQQRTAYYIGKIGDGYDE